MSLERYLKDDMGLRKYIELMESTPTAKRKSLMDAARPENPLFVETAEKYVLTFEKITRLPEMELTEVLGASGLKPEWVAWAINSVEDEALREKLIKHLPRNVAGPILLEIKETPKPKIQDIGTSRFNLIMKARELEKAGKLESVQVPHFERGYFQKKAA